MATSDIMYPTMSLYMQNTFINHVLRSASASGSYVWIALYNNPSTNPNARLIELSGSGYSRISASGLWTITSTGSAVNSTVLTFPSASPAWGGITHLGIINNPTGGSLLFYGPVSASRFVSHEGDSIVIAQGEIGIKLGKAYSTFLSKRLLGHYLNNSPIFYTPGSSVFLALYHTLPSADDGGGREVSGSVGYSRIQFPTSACWVLPTSGSTNNVVPIIFTTETPTPWGRLTGIVLRDHPTAGSMLFYGGIYPNVALINPDGFKFDAAGIKVYSSTTE